MPSLVHLRWNVWSVQVVGVVERVEVNGKGDCQILIDPGKGRDGVGSASEGAIVAVAAGIPASRD